MNTSIITFSSTQKSLWILFIAIHEVDGLYIW